MFSPQKNLAFALQLTQKPTPPTGLPISSKQIAEPDPAPKAAEPAAMPIVSLTSVPSSDVHPIAKPMPMQPRVVFSPPSGPDSLEPKAAAGAAHPDQIASENLGTPLTNSRAAIAPQAVETVVGSAETPAMPKMDAGPSTETSSRLLPIPAQTTVDTTSSTVEVPERQGEIDLTDTPNLNVETKPGQVATPPVGRTTRNTDSFAAASEHPKTPPVPNSTRHAKEQQDLSDDTQDSGAHRAVANNSRTQSDRTPIDRGRIQSFANSLTPLQSADSPRAVSVSVGNAPSASKPLVAQEPAPAITGAVKDGPASTHPIRDVSLRLSTPASGHVDVQLSERAGRVQVAVRTPDQELSKNLQTNLGELVGRLEEKGYRTEAWVPGNVAHAATTLRDASGSANSQSPPGNSGSQGGFQNDRQGQRESNQRSPQRWKAELEETLSPPNTLSDEEE